MKLINTDGGRKLFRHPSNRASILEYNENKIRQRICILDAQYRDIKKFGGSNFDVSELKRTKILNSNENYKIDGVNMPKNYNEVSISTMTDSHIDELWRDTYDSMSAKDKCDLWIEYPETDAVCFARSIELNNQSCNIPTISQLMRIFIEADNIDLMDASPPQFSHFLLGKKSKNGYWAFNNNYNAWSSSNYNKDHVVLITYKGEVTYTHKRNYEMVIPILEIGN